MRILSSLSLLAVLIALVIVALGGIKSTKSALTPNTGILSGSQTVVEKQKLQTLYTEAQLAERSGHLNSTQLTHSLAQSEPASQVGQRKGVLVRIIRSRVQLCTPNASTWLCGTGPLRGGQLAFHSGPTLAKART